MKDSEFIALLNLYLDHEISAADAARLEAEVQANPARREIYAQYCRMQKACKVLSADFVSAEEAAAAPANRKVVAFNLAAAEAAAARRRRAGNRYMWGAAAALAACVAIVFVGQNHRGVGSSDTVTLAAGSVMTASDGHAVETTRPTLGAAVAAGQGPRALGSASVQGAKSTLVAESLTLAGAAQAEALMVAAMDQAKSQTQLAWIEGLKFAPLQQPVPLSELRFENASAPLRPESRALGSRAGEAANVELAAFQFRK